MAGFLRYWPNGASTSSILAFDVVESEEVAREADITDHPVEKGANVSDHVRQKPQTIRITADVSNTPIEPSSTSTYLPDAQPHPRFELATQADNGRPGDDARTTLEQIHAAGDTVELYLGTDDAGRTYPNMELQALSFPRDAKTGEMLRFTASFKEVRIVQSQTVAIPTTAIPRAQGSANRGKQPTSEASDADTAQSGSVLHQWFGDSVRP